MPAFDRTHYLSALIVLLLTAAPVVAAAQQLVLRGRVETDSGTPLPYAIVQLLPFGRRQFADGRGAFTLTGVVPGSYRLAVRQVGFAPLDTAVTVGHSDPPLRLTLHRLPVRLAAITVQTDAACPVPPVVDPSRDSALATIFSELFENARRFQLMADEYPFTYRMERAATDFDVRDNVAWQGVDTIEIQSDERWRYQPGGMLRPGIGPGGRPARVIQVPQLPDLADSVFRSRHCFRYAGEAVLDTTLTLMVEFKAARSLRSLDVDGTAYLDARSYAVRRIDVRVVPAAAIPNVTSIEMAVEFREVQPHILVPRRIRTLTQLVTGVSGRLRRQEEEQRLVRVHWRRPLDASP